MTTYQVIAECAHATVNDPLYGRTMQLLLKGALIPDGTPELPHLLAVGMVAPVHGETGGLNADGVPSAALGVQVPAGVTSTPVEVTDEQRQAAEQARADAEQATADAEVEARRAAARAKLPEGGALPDGRASKDVWVEWLVAAGSRYEDVVGVDKGDLVELARQRQQ
jgi:hypothetical protein